MNCPTCEADCGDAAAWCPECGAPLEDATCRSCEAALLEDANFCTQCGSPVRDRAPVLPWAVAGAAVLALAIVLILPATRQPGPMGRFAGAGAPFAGGMTGSGGTEDPGATPPPLTGTPRQQADRLFERIMETFAAGDSAEARFFLPMALAAYRRAGDLDADGLYHMSLLYAAAGNARAARAAAKNILRGQPDHLLALAAAAEAAILQGDDAAASEYYRHYLDSYADERDAARSGYEVHAPMLTQYLRAAEAFLGR